MSVYNGSDNEDLELKQEPMDSGKVKCEEFTPGLKSEDAHSESQDLPVDAKLQEVTESASGMV